MLAVRFAATYFVSSPTEKNQRATSWPAPISANVPYVSASRLSASALCRVLVAFSTSVASGLLIMAASTYWMALMNLYISPTLAIWPRVVLIIGLSLLFAPLNVAAFLYVPKQMRGAAVGVRSMRASCFSPASLTWVPPRNIFSRGA